MTQMIEVNVAEATGAALDWMVGQALGAEVKGHAFSDSPGSYVHQNCTVFPSGGFFENEAAYSNYEPSTDWSDGGRLIDKLQPLFTFCQGSVRAEVVGGVGMGATYLVAFCRAIVTARLGDKVMVPVELIDKPEDAQPGAGN